MAAVDPNVSTRPTGAPLLDRLLSSTSPTENASTSPTENASTSPTEADILNRLHSLPDTALFTPTETSIYINVARDLLRAWRWRGCGPAYVGHGHLIRYRKAALDRFIGDERPEAA
jgi:hypothetical protein